MRFLVGVGVVAGAVAVDLLDLTSGAFALIAPRPVVAPAISAGYQAVQLIPGKGFDDAVIAGPTIRNAAYDRAEDPTLFTPGRYLDAIRADAASRGLATCSAADCSSVESYNLYLVLLTLQNAGGAAEALQVGVEEYPLSPVPRPMNAFSLDGAAIDPATARQRGVTVPRLDPNAVVNVPLYVVLVPTDPSGAEIDNAGLQYLLGSGAVATEVAFSYDEARASGTETVLPITTRVSLVIPQVYTD